MPQTRWTRLRYLDWESEDVSNKRDTEPQQCAYHDVTWWLTCVQAGPPQGRVSPDKAVSLDSDRRCRRRVAVRYAIGAAQS